MKKILFALMLLPILAFSQTVPDTIFVEALTDTTFLIAVGERNRNNSKLNIRYIDNVFDSSGVANFAYNRIEENENLQWNADKIKLKADALTALYGDVNGILQAFTGAGYLAGAFERHSLSYIGYYRATRGATQSFFVLNIDGTAQQVNAQGQPIPGGFSGTWDVITAFRWRLKDFFPTNVLPAGSIFNRLDVGQSVFQAIGSNVIVTKIQAITTEE